MRGADLSALVLVDVDGVRQALSADAFPVDLGGAASAVDLAGAPLAAHLGLDGVDVFVQPAAGATPVLCNGSPLTASRWLRPGDRLRIGRQRLRCVEDEGELALVVEAAAPEEEAAPPQLVPPPREDSPSEPGPRIRPLAYTPPRPVSTRRLARRLPWRRVSLVGLIALLVLPAWFLFAARSVEVRVAPEPDELRIEGGWLRPRVGGGYLLRPGPYRVRASKEGYRDLDHGIEVGAAARQTIELEMVELPGLLAVRTVPPTGAAVWIDGAEAGSEPLAGLEVERGERRVRLAAEGYVEHEETVAVEGLGRRQEIAVELVPLWAEVSFASVPAGARVVVDGKELGVTPLTARLLAGGHRLELELARFATARRSFRVEPDTPLELPSITLAPAAAALAVTSRPDGASVMVGDAFRGTTPLSLELAPGREHEVVVSKEGYDTERRRLELEPDERRDLDFELVARLGEIEVKARPAGAELVVDGESMGEANQVVRLIATPHEIEVRLAGFVTQRRTVTPRPGLRQTLEIALVSVEEDAAPVAAQQVIRTAQNQELRLIAGGTVRMGASRREAGRRANETLRTVEITRPFYLATEEVSNRQYREFANEHRSGRVGHVNLEIDHHPVVRVTWEDAVRYCNWLSVRDALPAFYRQSGGTWVPVEPLTNGYRLPFESEWAWAARYPDGRNALKYPWGDSLPVPPGAGNYADAQARALLRDALAGYDDGFPATAPVSSFEPNALGLRNLGGNVAEWVHDHYSLYAGSAGATETDPMGPANGEFHVIRGSSWMHDSVSELRLSYRDYGTEPRPDLGFRIARFLEAPK